ncbi:MAG: DUF2460 domain-containing protein [Pseudomonadota bacterium]
MSHFHEVRFPTGLSFGSTGGPERRTDIVTLSNGFEERNSPWAHSRHRYDAGLGARSLDDLQAIIAFFEARHGRLYGFRWKDWADFSSGSRRHGICFDDQEIGIGDGEAMHFQLSKTYQSGEAAYQRDITKPISGTVKIGRDGVEQEEGNHYTVDLTTGLVTFVNAPAQTDRITAGFEFDVPVRFDTDRLDINAAGFEAGDIPSIPVVELRL